MESWTKYVLISHYIRHYICLITIRFTSFNLMASVVVIEFHQWQVMRNELEF